MTQPLRSPLFNKVAIIGVGMMGGSIGLALKKYNVARHIVGTSQHEASLAHALKAKVIDQAAQDLKSAVNHADLVILAAPVKSIIEILPLLAKHVHRNCLITDVGSTKMGIVDAAQKNLPNATMFVGSHPLTGSEKTGAVFANPDLFIGATCIMTPNDQTNRLAKEKVKQFWSSLGANVKFMSAKEHDQILSYISHLPHLLAYGLMEAIPSEFLEYATQGLRDTTRIAGSSPDMWKDICLTNSRNIVKSMDEFVKVLSSMRKAMTSRDEQILMEVFQRSRGKRENIAKSS